MLFFRVTDTTERALHKSEWLLDTECNISHKDT